MKGAEGGREQRRARGRGGVGGRRGASAARAEGGPQVPGAGSGTGDRTCPRCEAERRSGLSAAEAARRLAAEGPNELPSQRPQSLLASLAGVLKEPMLLLLLAAGMIYLAIGEEGDAVMLLLFVLVVIAITFVQERRTERALEALRGVSSPRAIVVRDGGEVRVPGREVVRGDLIVLKEGDRVPADAVVLECANLLVDESLLTGESQAVRKAAWDGGERPEHPGGDDLPYVYSGSLVVRGHGLARVEATGLGTELGRIGRALETLAEEETLIKRETSTLVRNFGAAGIALSALVVVLYGIVWGNWLEGLLAGLSLSMAILPEEFSVVLVVFLAMGAWRMSKRHVLTRRMPAVETLGAATVLCVDKTGTLTMNRMVLASMWAGGESLEVGANEALPEEFHGLLEFGSLASQADPFDPIEREIQKGAQLFLNGTEHVHETWTLEREYPLSREMLALSHAWASHDASEHVVAAKGAPEAVVDLCHLGPSEREAVLSQARRMSDRGLRILGVAKATFPEGELPDGQHDFPFELVGLLGFTDPVRPQVAPSLAECYAAGIRVIMITGDYPGTAQHVARKIGLRGADRFITGPELAAMAPEELRERIRTVNIFARVVPEQKLAIVAALKANGEVVAMTGDGVNDAPALKAAHIGVAMGERGTDVARESAALVLLDDDFSSIVQAVRLGRRIFDNLKKAIGYIVAVHVPIAGMALVPIVSRTQLVLLPEHIAFLELIIDPACSTVYEAQPEEGDVMRRPPRSLGSRLFGRRALATSLVQGLSVLAVVAFIFLFALRAGKGEEEARTLTFATLVIANLALIAANLSWSSGPAGALSSENRALWLVGAGAVASLLAVLYVPALREAFHFSVLHPDDLAAVVLAGLASVAWFWLLDVRTRIQRIRLG